MISYRWRSSARSLLTAFLGVLAASPARAVLPEPTARLGTCNPQMARAQELFPKPGGLNVVVVRFVGQDEPSEKMGTDLGYTLTQELPEYTRRSMRLDAQAAGLDGDELHIQYVPCLISTHRQAREVGQAWDADVVFWGQSSCSRSDPASCKLSPVVANGAHVTVQVQGDVNAKGNVQIGVNDNRKLAVTVPSPSGVFKTSVTLVRWRGLERRSEKGVRVDPAAVMDLDFPRLASEQPLALFRFMVGLYASHSQKYALAAAQFEEVKSSLYVGAEQKSELYRLIGQSFLFAGQPVRGLAALEQARASCETTDVRCQAEGLSNLGWAVDRLGDTKKALAYFRQAAAAYKQVGDRAGHAITLNNIGFAYHGLGDKKKALSYYEQALPVCKEVGDREGHATTLNNIGRVYAELGDKQRALTYYEEALPIQRQVGDHEGMAVTLDNIGSAYSSLGDMQKALSYYEQALPLRKQVGDYKGEAETLSSIGRVHAKMGDQQKSLVYQEQALPLFKQVSDREGEAKSLYSIGRVYDKFGDQPKALVYYEQALALFNNLGNREYKATALNNIGRMYGALGDQPKALSYQKQALSIQKQIGDRHGEAYTLNDIGLVYTIWGDEEEALSYYEQALLLLKELGDRENEAVTLHNMAAVLAKLGRPKDAISRYRAAASCYLAHVPPHTRAALGSLGQGFGLGLRSKLWSQAAALLSEMERLQPSAVQRIWWRARLAWYSGAGDAAQRYQELSQRAGELQPAVQDKVRVFATAGELRASNRARWPECPGVVITQVEAGPEAERLGMQAGDIVIRYQGQCIFEPEDLVVAASKTQPSQSVTLELWRKDRLQAMIVHGGRLGIALESF